MLQKPLNRGDALGWCMKQSELLKRTSARLFNDVFHTNVRNGERILQAKLDGPMHTSYWPNKVRDIAMWQHRAVSMEIPLESTSVQPYVTSIGRAFTHIPVSLHHVARENMTEWRRKRGLGVKKSEAKVTATNMGKKK